MHSIPINQSQNREEKVEWIAIDYRILLGSAPLSWWQAVFGFPHSETYDTMHACRARWHIKMMPRIEKKYVNVTQLRVVARPDLSLGVAPDAPTPMSRSCTASLVVVCLAEARVDILLLVSSSWRY